jgi:hypothetical protein
MNSYFNQSDFNPGGKYGPDAEAMQDLIDQASPFNVANSPRDSSSSWNDFDLTKVLTALDKSQRRKKYSNRAEQTPRFGFSNQNNRNPGAFPLGQDAVILPGSDQMGGAGGYTIPGGSPGASTAQKLGQVALSVAPFTGPAAPIVAGAGAIASLFG